MPLVFLFTARSCDDRVKEPEGENGELTYALGDTLTLVKGEPLMLKAEKLNLTYTENKDNRCPTGVNCVMAGKAKVSLKVEKAPTEEVVNLEVKGLCEDRNGACGNQAAAQGYRFRILTADPYPGSEEAKSRNASSSIRLMVTAAQ